MNVLEINNLTKFYGKKEVLKEVGFECKTGEIIGLFGRNGTGKSALLKLLFGTVKADAISMKINSEIIIQKDIISSKQIAYLPQDTFLSKGSRVRDIIPLFFSDGEAQNAIFYAPQISEFETLKVGELSLGQLRYLELLIIGNLKHPFLLLDEPFSMVEPIYKEVIKELLLKLKTSKGIIITDHYYQDVLEITDSNYLLKEGKCMKIGNKEDLVTYEYLSSI